MKKIKVAIIGASGYTGCELIRILSDHSQVQISYLIANNNAGQKISSLYPQFSNIDLPILSKLEDVDFSNLDAVFGCLPHGSSHSIFEEILRKSANKNLKIIDLSADFRIQNIEEYQKWYHTEHLAPDLQKKAIYGLTEINREKIKKSNLIACPGCYPTSIILPLYPLLKYKIINNENIIIDSKSGTSGAGRNLKTNNLFCEINESVKAYSIGNHRHIAEIEQALSIASDSNIIIEFTPHLLPINRGIISTIYCSLNDKIKIEDAKNCLNKFYEDEFFINIKDNELSIREVIGTNFCNISINKGRKENQLIIVSVIDNLCKGASGQAVQNFNIMFNLDENEGLRFKPIFP